jgi:hypothetical protein
MHILPEANSYGTLLLSPVHCQQPKSPELESTLLSLQAGMSTWKALEYVVTIQPSHCASLHLRIHERRKWVSRRPHRKYV